MKFGKSKRIDGFLLEADQLARNRFYREALELYQSVYSDQAKDHRAMFGIAACLFRLGRSQDSIRWLKRILDHDPNHEKAKKLMKKLESQRDERSKRPTLLDSCDQNFHDEW